MKTKKNKSPKNYYETVIKTALDVDKYIFNRFKAESPAVRWLLYARTINILFQKFYNASLNRAKEAVLEKE